jgi:ankyrin repeat protein
MNSNTIFSCIFNNDLKHIKKIIYDRSIRNINGLTPIALAYELHRFEILKYLLDNGGDIEEQDFLDETLLFKAFYENKINCIDFLIKNGADIKCERRYGITPLFKAGIENKISSITTMLLYGMDINSKNIITGDTLLHIAVTNNYPDLAKFLVQNGINTKTKNIDGNTALELCDEVNKENFHYLKYYKLSKIMKKCLLKIPFNNILLNIYNEVKYRPGNSGYEESKTDFENR